MRRHAWWAPVLAAVALLPAAALAPAASAKPKPGATTSSTPAIKAIPATTTTVPPTTTTEPPATTAAPTTPPSAPPVEKAATPAPEPKVTVTPNRNLQHLQEVQVSGSGFAAGEGVNVTACRADATDAFEGCDISNFASVTADEDGNWSTSFTVHVRLPLSGIVDCTEFGACVIAGVHGDDFTTEVRAPIGFVPDAVPDPPHVTVKPRTGLAHGQQVTITGSGAAPDALLLVSECADLQNRYPECAQEGGGFIGADAEGNIELPVTVSRVFGYPYSGAQITDCLVDECFIRVAALDGLYNFADVRITFDPDAPLPPRPSLTVTPAKNLVHDQVVHVSGSGFVPDVGVQLIECSSGGDPYPQCGYDTGQGLQADSNGTIDTTLTVKRVLGYPGQSVDCLEVGCVVHANSNVNDVFKSVEVPIAFDPDAPLPPPPVVTITPDRDLEHNDLLSVRGKGFTKNTFVEIAECAVTDEANGSYGPCIYQYGNLQTDANGAFTTTFAVKRIITSYPGQPTTDCLDVEGCELRVYAGEDPLTSFAELELDFDRNAPLPPPPTLTVTPDSDLGGRELVRVHGEGFAPDTDHTLAECQDDTGPVNNNPCTWGTVVRTDAQGTIDTTFLARRFLPRVEGPVDCVDTGECAVTVSTFDDALSHAAHRVTFDPDAPPPPQPTITVTPSEGLTDDSVVTVTGRDFVPNTGIGVTECRGSDASGLACDASIATFLQSDDQGRFTLDYTVHPGLLTRDGIIGCYDAPGACSIQASTFGEVGGVSNAVLLTFGASVTPPGDGGGGAAGGGSDGGATPRPVEPAPRLAFTGTPVRGYLEFAAIFLGLGTLLVLASRRRRRRLP